MEELKRVVHMSECKTVGGFGVLNGNLDGDKLIPNYWNSCSSVDCYNPDSDTWFTVPKMSNDRCAPVGDRDTLYVVGAFNSTDLSWNKQVCSVIGGANRNGKLC